MQAPVLMDGIESDLLLMFKPIEPDPVFIKKLAGRLSNPKMVQIEKTRIVPIALALVGSGLAMGALVYLVYRITRVCFKRRLN